MQEAIYTDIVRVRSHKYPNEDDDIYTDTTYYDRNDEYFDLGYQRLKLLNLRQYPEFTYLKKLFIDHNELKILPEPKYIPHLEQLNCSSNKLTELPFYPKLNFLNISGNQITNCSLYHKSNLIYLDCSYNDGFCMNFVLPKCKHLYINDTKIQNINLELVPIIEILDAGNNKLTHITGGSNLIELNIQHNSISELPDWPGMLRLMADFNQIGSVPIYPKLTSLSISYNKLTKICNQPRLKKLIANNNNINSLEHLPELELIDLWHNNLSSVEIPKHAEYVSLQFNPIKNIILSPDVLKNIKEIQINFETYKNIYQTYNDNFNAVMVITNRDELERILKKLSGVFDECILEYIFKKFSTLKFCDRETALYKTTLAVFWKFFTNKKYSSVEELVATEPFKHLLKNLTYVYYKTIVISLYLNQ